MALAGVVPSGENTSLLLEREAEGMTNEEIAQTLFVTIKTVEVHLSHAYRKLEISSRAQLEQALTPAPGLTPASASA
jgi:DNA-binding NarL/FixJ family response regulator